jgi:hypothetical protein
MLRRTYSILAVALTASACGGTTESPNHPSTKQDLAEELSRTSLDDALKRRDHFSPLCDGDGYPLPGNINNKEGAGTTVAEFCNAIKPPVPKPDASTDATPACDLNALNMELSNVIVDDAIAQHAHFRCLCDDKGYPLVGNINAKGATASQFCSAMKEKGLL